MTAARQTLRRRLAPLRVRLTLAFASVMAVVLALTAGLIYAQFAADLTQRTDTKLAGHQATILSAPGEPTPASLLTLLGEPLAQVYDAGGAVIASTSRLRDARLLTNHQVGSVREGALVVTVAGQTGDEDGARVRAFRLPGGEVVAVAEDLDLREHALHRLAVLLAIGMLIALFVASLTGYQVAKAALAPVERMRARASEIGAGDPGERLPVPDTYDEVQLLAETINDLLGRLESTLERERRIVGDASHELRTPISILRARVGFALRAEHSRAELLDVLRGVDTDAARLATLADDLLILARADQGALGLRHDPLDVQELLEAAAARSRAIDPSVTARVVMEIEGGAVVLGDQPRLEQLLDNLLHNARTYGATPLTLTARHVAGDDASVVAIDLADSGPGFPPEFVPRAFERFSQADPSHGNRGSGLGLAIVEAIAEAHGGRVHLGETTEGGAVVTVLLRAA